MVEQLYWIAFNCTGMPNKEDCVCLYPSGKSNTKLSLCSVIANCCTVKLCGADLHHHFKCETISEVKPKRALPSSMWIVVMLAIHNQPLAVPTHVCAGDQRETGIFLEVLLC